MVRIPPERGAAARMEVRLGDATANPYLAMAAVGAAAYLGIREKAEPPAKLEGLWLRPCRRGLLPAGWPRRLTRWRLTMSSPRCSASYFVTSFLTYKRNEVERFERYVTDWEFREYAYHL